MSNMFPLLKSTLIPCIHPRRCRKHHSRITKQILIYNTDIKLWNLTCFLCRFLWLYSFYGMRDFRGLPKLMRCKISSAIRFSQAGSSSFALNLRKWRRNLRLLTTSSHGWISLLLLDADRVLHHVGVADQTHLHLPSGRVLHEFVLIQLC